MTQEEKQLLFKDLCGRLPYGVMMKVTPEGGGPGGVESYDIKLNIELLDVFSDFADVFKPYLRPMSSMTKEEKKEFDDFCVIDEFVWSGNTEKGYPNQAIIMSEGIDWLLAHHFDYRGLIEKGLALEAPEGMYNKEESEKGSEIPIPKTVDEAVKTLANIVSKEDRDYLLENGAISMHHSLGRWIRNEWGLWTDSELKNELKKKGFEHPDDMSNYIIEEFIKYCLENLI